MNLPLHTLGTFWKAIAPIKLISQLLSLRFNLIGYLIARFSLHNPFKIFCFKLNKHISKQKCLQKVVFHLLH